MDTKKINNLMCRKECPLCSSKEIEFIDYISAPKPILFGSTPVFFNNKIEFYKCKKCNSFFNSKIIFEKESIDLYKNSEENKWAISSFEEDKTEDLISVVKKYLFKGAKVLDIGCNDGTLLDYAANLGAETYGTEYSELAVKHAKSKGHKIYKNFDEIPLENKFDVVFAFDVIEHLYNVRDFLNYAKDRLNKNGVLIILTGNPDYFLVKIFRGKWWYFAIPEHIVFPSEKFFSLFSGFNLVSYSKLYNSKKYFLNNIFHIDKQIIKKIKIILISFLRNRYYYNFPFIGKDHSLVVLKNIKFSIVTPTYNSEEYISETIESVLNQRGNFEIEYIVVDGLSSDSTMDIVNKYKKLLDEKKWIVKCISIEMKVISEKDSGMYDAINKGFDLATGDIYAYINSDDIYLQGAFSIISETFKKNTKVEWLKGITSYIDKNSIIYQIGNLNVYNRKLIKEGVYGRSLYFIQQDSIFWSSKLWDLTGPIDPKLKYAGDYYLWIKFANFCTLYSVEAYVSCFRKREGQLSENIKSYTEEMQLIKPSGFFFKIFFYKFFNFLNKKNIVN